MPNIAAAEPAFKFNRIHCIIGSALSLGHAHTLGRDVQHASAIGHQLPVFHRRAGVEYFRSAAAHRFALQSFGCAQLNRAALLRVCGIAIGRHHDSKRGCA